MNKEWLKSITDVSEIYEDISIDKYKIPFLAIGTNGIYVCMEHENAEVVDAIKKELRISDYQLFVFAIEDRSFYDYASGFVAFEDIYAAFENCYLNHLIPEADLVNIEFDGATDYCSEKYVETVLFDEDMEKAYIAPVIGMQKITEIVNRLEMSLNKPEQHGNYRVYPDGTMMVKKELTKKVGMFQTSIPVGEGYFPCSDIDGDKMFLITLFGGMFGAHKFVTGQYMSGLSYLLTFGFCGVSYILDLISMIIGGYSYSVIESGQKGLEKKRYFNRPVTKKILACAATMIAAFASYFIIRYGYLPLVQTITSAVTNLLINSDLPNTLYNSMQ